MTRWFRFYDDAVNDPKVQLLPPEAFKAWVNLLCIASKHGGFLPDVDAVAFILRIKPEKVRAQVSDLRKRGLLDDNDGIVTPHNWSARQFKSDVSNERVKRHRERKCNVTETPDATPPEQIQKAEQKLDRDTRASVPVPEPERESKSLIRPEAFDLSAQCLTAMGVSAADPIAVGLPYNVEMWLSAGASAPLILATVARVGANKNLKYLDKCVRGELAAANEEQPRRTQSAKENRNGSTGNIVDAARRNLENGIDFGPRPQPPGLASGPASPRLLSQGRS